MNQQREKTSTGRGGSYIGREYKIDDRHRTKRLSLKPTVKGIYWQETRVFKLIKNSEQKKEERRKRLLELSE